VKDEQREREKKKTRANVKAREKRGDNSGSAAEWRRGVERQQTAAVAVVAAVAAAAPWRFSSLHSAA